MHLAHEYPHHYQAVKQAVQSVHEIKADPLVCHVHVMCHAPLLASSSALCSPLYGSRADMAELRRGKGREALSASLCFSLSPPLISLLCLCFIHSHTRVHGHASSLRPISVCAQW